MEESSNSLRVQPLYQESRRLSAAGSDDDFDVGRRTSFANTFLEGPAEFDFSRYRTRFGSLHHVPLEEETHTDALSTPPITPLRTHLRSHSGLSTQASYFPDTHGWSMSQPSSPRSSQQPATPSIFDQIFETISSAGESLDLHNKATDLVGAQRASKGKQREVLCDESKQSLPNGNGLTALEDVMVEVFDKAESKVTQFWSWLTEEPRVGSQ